MSWIDIFLSLIILLVVYFGVKRGLICSLIIFSSYIVIFYLSFNVAPAVQDSLIKLLKFSEALAIISSYILIILVVMIAARFLVFIMQKLLNFLYLGWLDKIGGLIFAIASIIMLMILFITIIDLVDSSGSFYVKTEDSVIIRFIKNLKDYIFFNYVNPDQLSESLTEKIL